MAPRLATDRCLSNFIPTHCRCASVETPTHHLPLQCARPAAQPSRFSCAIADVLFFFFFRRSSPIDRSDRCLLLNNDLGDYATGEDDAG